MFNFLCTRYEIHCTGTRLTLVEVTPFISFFRPRHIVSTHQIFIHPYDTLLTICLNEYRQEGSVVERITNLETSKGLMTACDGVNREVVMDIRDEKTRTMYFQYRSTREICL